MTLTRQLLTVSLVSPWIPSKLSNLFSTTDNHFKLTHDLNPCYITHNKPIKNAHNLFFFQKKKEKKNHETESTSSEVRLLSLRSSFSRFLKLAKQDTWAISKVKKVNIFGGSKLKGVKKSKGWEWNPYIWKCFVIELKTGNGTWVAAIVVLQYLLPA